MNITIVFFTGLVIALIGVVPPGLINMSAARISLKDGHSRGIFFSIGACIVVAAQTTIAVVFAKYLSNHPSVIDVLQRVAFVVFVLITVYFLVLAQKQAKPKIEANIKSKHSSFFQGMFISSLNILPIPYQAYMVLTLASLNFMAFDKTSITSYVSGAVMGTFVMLYIYIFFFEKIKSKKLTSQKSMNYIIGTITGIIAIITLINIIKEL